MIDVTRLNVQPGEVLAVRAPANIASDERAKVIAFLDHHMPGVHVLLVAEGVGFVVLAESLARTTL